MKLNKFISATVFVTAFSLLYVYQQTEVFRLAYVGQKKASSFQDLLDKNSFLRYNIERSTSLTRIGSKISGAHDYEMPESYRLVRLNRPPAAFKLARHVYKKETLLSRLFGIKRQAEARQVNP
ncbi:MAG: hypothetical protein FJZ15_00640 [Candidatus Omnitrophica bacterium]|nr:hypothetical protein [Candidatus Omnitrophota bacterium]